MPSSLWKLLPKLSFAFWGLSSSMGCVPERYTEAFYPEGEIREVVILGDAGSVAIEVGERLRVERTIRGAERALSLSHEVEDGALILESRCKGLLPCAVDIDLQLAESLPVFVVLESGEVSIREVGYADIELSRGVVEVENAGDFRVRLGQGNVVGTVRDGERIDVVVAHGSVALEVPAVPWDVEVEADESDIHALQVSGPNERQLKIVANGGTVTVLSESEVALRTR